MGYALVGAVNSIDAATGSSPFADRNVAFVFCCDNSVCHVHCKVVFRVTRIQLQVVFAVGSTLFGTPESDCMVSNRSSTLDGRCTFGPCPSRGSASSSAAHPPCDCRYRECDTQRHGNREKRANDWCTSGLLHFSSCSSYCATAAVAQNVLLRWWFDLLLPAWTSTADRWLPVHPARHFSHNSADSHMSNAKSRYL